MPQFDASSFSSQLFWLIVIFSTIYLLVSHFIAPRAESILSNRDQILNENIGLAKDYKRQAESIEIEKHEKLAQVNHEVEEEHSKAEKILVQHFDKQKSELSLLIKEQQEKSLAEINQYIETFHAKEKESSIRISGLIIKKITGQEANSTILDKIINKSR